MSRMISRGADILSIAIGVIVGGSVLMLAGAGTALVPVFDAWLFPVIRVDDITDIARDAGKACFTLHLTKVRAAVPISYQWHATAPLSPPIGVAVYLAGPDNKRLPAQHLETHPTGSSWLRRYCFDMPGTLGERDTLTMTGEAFHQRVPMWQTETRLPAFTIEPAMGLLAR